MIKFTVEGEPTGKGRPRFAGKRCYTPKKTSDYEDLVRLYYKIGNTIKYETGALKCEIKAYLKIPKSDSKKTFKEKLLNLIRPTKKPDCDNIAKIVLDALNDYAYKDDSQVVDLHVMKYYSDMPRVEIVISEIV